MKFLCDQMLVRLGRWLRAAGHDTEIVLQSIPDREIWELACQEKRLLITRDRHFLDIDPHQDNVIYLQSNDLESCVKELTYRLKIDWLQNPFSRCLVCNQPLVEADLEAVQSVLPEIRIQFHQFRFCPHCQKVYWLGSHTQRMLQSLNRWQLKS